MGRDSLQEMNHALTEILPGGIAGFRPNERSILFSTPGLLALAGLSPDDPMLERDTWYYDLIEPEDRARIGRESAEQIARQGRSELVYRIRRPDGSRLWVKQYAGGVESAYIGAYFLCLIVDYSETKRAQREAEQAEHQMNSIINSVPGGVGRFSLDRDLQVLLASDGYYRLCGYSREEFAGPRMDHRAAALVLEEDRQTLRQAIRALVEEGKPLKVEYRIRKKDGSIAWHTAFCARSDQTDGRQVMDAVVIDTTETKRLEQERRLNAERYRIVSEQSQDIIFDWDLDTDVISHSAAIEEKLGRAVEREQPLEQLLASPIYFDEDRPVVLELARGVRRGERYQEGEYRLVKGDGTPVWFQVRVTALFDEAGKPIRAIGVLADIDSYKRENADLQERAERDLLTGLLNRVTFEEKLAERVVHRLREHIHAFYLLDIDNFKEINDTLGHDRGDQVLVRVAECIREQFREEDLIGRMGGDEFAVLVADLPSTEAAVARAEQLSWALRGAVEEGVLSGSVGIAVCPGHGETFQELYRHADVALYTSKRNGRNCSSVYEPPARK